MGWLNIVIKNTVQLTHGNILLPAAGTDKPTIRLLNKHVRDEVAPRWRELGIQLLNDEQCAKLHIIEVNCHDVMTCCTELFKYWLSVDTDASWNKLIAALEMVNEIALAKKIKIVVFKGLDLIHIANNYVYTHVFSYRMARNFRGKKS